MIYKTFGDTHPSMLGMGTMRLPKLAGGTKNEIDVPAARQVLRRAYEAGINYFDTAYMYHGGQSETVVGEFLRQLPRESFYLADKFPGMHLKPGDGPARVREIFEEQLARCGVEYFDFYLLHNLSAPTYPVYTEESYGVLPYLLEQKRLGRIRHLGVSSHATPEMLRDFLDRTPEIEFVQIQLNYFDWEFQRAKEQYECIVGHGLPVWVMEPCRGGRLAALHPESDALLKAAAPDRTVASWAFRYLQTLPGVTVVLSGMNAEAQVADNLRTFSAPCPLSSAESEVLTQAVQLMKDRLFVPCTRCRYCDCCPRGLDIPLFMERYNAYRLAGTRGPLQSLAKLPPEKQPAACASCGLCASRCPQSIAIPTLLKEMADVLRA